MTVAELILELQSQPQDLEVFIMLPSQKQFTVDEVGFCCPELSDPYISLFVKPLQKRNAKTKNEAS